MWRKVATLAVPVVLVALIVVSVSADTVTVTVTEAGFDPQVITVPIRTEVVWVNAGSSPHTVTALGNEFSSGVILPGGTYSFLFAAPGEYPYRDLLSTATGKVVVGEGVYRIYFPLIMRNCGGEQ